MGFWHHRKLLDSKRARLLLQSCPSSKVKLHEFIGGFVVIVAIDRALAVDRYRVACDEYARCASVASRDRENPSFAQGGRDSAIVVNWDDAKDYVAWLRE